MELSVVIVAYNAAEFLPACLGSVRAALAGVEHEVILVDNASTDGGPAWVRRAHPGATLIINRENLGFAKAMNVGLRRASGEFILWLNPDAVLAGGSMRELLGVFRDRPRVGVIGPRLSDLAGCVQFSCRSFPSYRTALFNRGSLLTRLFPSNRFSRAYLRSDIDRARPQRVDWVSGACLLHRRALGGLDERFFMYCEDVDFCLRARRGGWDVLYHPALEARHRVAGSTRREAVRMIREHHRSMWAYYAKHFARGPFMDAAVGLAIGGRCGLKMLGERLLR